jgi:hypothetical protein
VLSGDAAVSKIDTPTANLQEPDGDDAEGERASSVELITTGPISSNVLVQTEPSSADRAALGAPSAGGHKWKHPPTIPNKNFGLSGDDSN